MNPFRQEILKAANKGRARQQLPLFRMRHIQRAVFKCRQKKLVSAETLRGAGFNA